MPAGEAEPGPCCVLLLCLCVAVGVYGGVPSPAPPFCVLFWGGGVRVVCRGVRLVARAAPIKLCEVVSVSCPAGGGGCSCSWGGGAGGGGAQLQKACAPPHLSPAVAPTQFPCAGPILPHGIATHMGAAGWALGPPPPPTCTPLPGGCEGLDTPPPPPKGKTTRALSAMRSSLSAAPGSEATVRPGLGEMLPSSSPGQAEKRPALPPSPPGASIPAHCWTVPPTDPPQRGHRALQSPTPQLCKAGSVPSMAGDARAGGGLHPAWPRSHPLAAPWGGGRAGWRGCSWAQGSHPALNPSLGLPPALCLPGAWGTQGIRGHVATAGSGVALCRPNPQPHAGQSPSLRRGDRDPIKDFPPIPGVRVVVTHHPRSPRGWCCPGRFWLQTSYLQLGTWLCPVPRLVLVGGPE